jgi:hypothetical protein
MHPMPRWLMLIGLMGCGRLNVDPLVADVRSGGDSPEDGDAPSAQGWVLVQTRASLGAPSLSVDLLGAQNLIIVAAQIAPGGTIAAVTDSSNCNSYVPIPAAHAFCIESELYIFYAKSSSACSGADTINLASTENVFAAVVWEVSGVRSDDPVDATLVLIEQADTTTPLGPRITTSADGEFVVSVMLVDNTISGIHPGNEFTNDQIAFGNGWAHLTDPMAKAGAYQAQWDQPMSGAYCTSAVAFKVAP